MGQIKYILAERSLTNRVVKKPMGKNELKKPPAIRNQLRPKLVRNVAQKGTGTSKLQLPKPVLPKVVSEKGGKNLPKTKTQGTKRNHDQIETTRDLAKNGFSSSGNFFHIYF